MHLCASIYLIIYLPGFCFFSVYQELDLEWKVSGGKWGSEVLFIIAPLNIKHIYDFYIIQIFITYLHDADDHTAPNDYYLLSMHW